MTKEELKKYENFQEKETLDRRKIFWNKVKTGQLQNELKNEKYLIIKIC